MGVVNGPASPMTIGVLDCPHADRITAPRIARNVRVADNFAGLVSRPAEEAPEDRHAAFR